jgi:hypothetical protein
MALTPLQQHVCQLLAKRRIDEGEAYVAGGTALNAILGAPRVSRDIDRFHDSAEAVRVSSDQDRAQLVAHGLSVELVRDLRGFVEAIVRDRTGAAVVIEWVQESAFRFFPLVEHPTLGLTMHPLDLATNKALALVGRVEVRDWVDILTCHQRLTPLGCLAWAASGKDAGVGPGFLLEQAARTARYSAVDLATLEFDGPRPSPGELSSTWRHALDEARRIVDVLPPENVGCVVLESGGPFKGDPDALVASLGAGRLTFHAGSVRGALPSVRAGS